MNGSIKKTSIRMTESIGMLLEKTLLEESLKERA